MNTLKESKQNWSDQVKLGEITLNNRICMAALTRERCNPKDGIPTPLLAQYYSQRAAAGMILTEATAWSQRGQGFMGAACLFNLQQAAGWKSVIQAVHQKKGKIFLQIVHAGRVTHPIKTGGLEPWAPNTEAVQEPIRDLNNILYPVPKMMTLEDIQQTKKQFQYSIKLAKQLNVDGIQIHAAHGYLIDQFLRSASNKRTDLYGGIAENRIRFCIQLVEITLKYFKPYQIGLKISPVSRIKDMYDENPQETFALLLKELSLRNIGFLEIRQSTESYYFPNRYPLSQKQQMADVCKVLRPYFNGLLIGNDSFTPETGLQKIREGLCDTISFGKLYISNPDLAERILQNQQINYKWDPSTFYGPFGAKGYTDYAFFSAKSEAEQTK